MPVHLTARRRHPGRTAGRRIAAGTRADLPGSRLCVAAVVVETLREDGRRRQIRQLALEEEVAAEAERSRWRQHHL